MPLRRDWAAKVSLAQAGEARRFQHVDHHLVGRAGVGVDDHDRVLARLPAIALQLLGEAVDAAERHRRGCRPCSGRRRRPPTITSCGPVAAVGSPAAAAA